MVGGTKKAGSAARHGGRATNALVAAVIAVGLVACGGTTYDGSPQSPSRSAHGPELAEGETAGIASQLVSVPGYRYVNVSRREVEEILGNLRGWAEKFGAPEFFRAVSMHSVVADDPAENTARAGSGLRETGFLMLFEFSDAPPAGLEGTLVRRIAGLHTPLGYLKVADTEVVVIERQGQPQSRYQLFWYRHGVLGQVDGADIEPLERWVRAYLSIPEREPEETDRLAEALKPIPGYAYVNWWEEEIHAGLERIFAGATATSSHLVVDRDGRTGGLMLAEIDLTTLDEVATRVEVEMGGVAEALTIAGVPVRRITVGRPLSGIGDQPAQMATVLWRRNGIAGVFLGDPDDGGTFLARFLAA